jgi:hypothetical protein
MERPERHGCFVIALHFSREHAMAQQRNAEGNDEQRRANAREARKAGKRPSEASATLGASKQRKEAKTGSSHQEKMDQKREGKEAATAKGTSGKPRPGNRKIDPKRTARWD